MSNQPQFRPWFRLATLARSSQPQTPAPTSEPRPSQPQTSAPTQAPRPSQPQTPTPTPAPRPQTQPPAPLPRPGPAQETAPRAPAPTTSAPAPPPASATSAARPPLVAPSPAPATTTSAPRAPASIPAAAPQPPAPAIRSPPAVTRTPTPAPPVSQKPPPTSSMPSPPQQPSLPSPPPLAATSRSVPPSPLKPSPPATSRSVPPSPSSPPKAVTPPKVPAFSPPKPSARETIAPSMPTSSPPKPSNGSPVTARVPTPTESPRTAKPVPETPPQSPKEKASLPPPSPFALPPSQLKPEGETEKKTVLVQQTAGKPKPYLESQGVDGGSHKPRDGMHVKPKDRHLYKTSSDSEDRGMRVITITGENKGAVMELGNLPGRRGLSLNSPAPHKLKSDGEKLSEGNLSRKEEKPKLQGRDHNAAPKSSVPMHAFTNSNVQGINSSIVYKSSLSHHDPGVHLSVTRKPLNGHGHGFQLKGHASDQKNTQKEKGLRFSE